MRCSTGRGGNRSRKKRGRELRNRIEKEEWQQIMRRSKDHHLSRAKDFQEHLVLLPNNIIGFHLLLKVRLLRRMSVSPSLSALHHNKTSASRNLSPHHRNKMKDFLAL
jgi:hypothetical protein